MYSSRIKKCTALFALRIDNSQKENKKERRKCKIYLWLTVDTFIVGTPGRTELTTIQLVCGHLLGPYLPLNTVSLGKVNVNSFRITNVLEGPERMLFIHTSVARLAAVCWFVSLKKALLLSSIIFCFQTQDIKRCCGNVLSGNRDCFPR